MNVIWNFFHRGLFGCAVFFAILATQASAKPPGQAHKATESIKLKTGPRDQKRSIEIVPGSGEAFTDCAASEPCPELVVVPASNAASPVGSPDDEPGRLKTEARHPVSLKAFAIGRTEVSVQEYMACVDTGSCRHPEWAEPGGEHNVETGTGITYKSIATFLTGVDQPIVGISWLDASDYAKWLSKRTGLSYRLPSETEWEYAARAGAETPYWWGPETTRDGKVMACCEGCGSDRDMKGLYPVESFEANPWGLHNVHGNAWEWVADFFCEDYSASPHDGSARLDSSCPKQSDPEGLKIFRGGSCFYGPRQMRASMRLRNLPGLRNMTIGFRVARDIN